MEELLTSVWSQAGALGLLAISGWVMWWLERLDRITKDKDIRDLQQSMLQLNNELNQSLKEILTSLSIEELFKEYVSKS